MTQAFLSDLREEKQRRLEAWGQGGYTTESADGTVQLNSKAIGEVTTLNEIVDQIETWGSLDTEDGVERVPS